MSPILNGEVTPSVALETIWNRDMSRGPSQTLGFLGLTLASLYESLPLTYFSASVFGLGYGGVGALYPAFTGDLFGRRYAASIAGSIFALAGAAAGIGVYLAGALYQASGSYTVSFALGGVLTFASLPLILLVRSPLSHLAAQKKSGSCGAPE